MVSAITDSHLFIGIVKTIVLFVYLFMTPLAHFVEVCFHLNGLYQICIVFWITNLPHQWNRRTLGVSISLLYNAFYLVSPNVSYTIRVSP